MNKLINWKQLSRFLTGNENSIKSSNIPSKYKDRVHSLIQMLEDWSNGNDTTSRPLKNRPRPTDKNGKKRDLTPAEIQAMVDTYNAKIKRQKESNGTDTAIKNSSIKQPNDKVKELQNIADSIE